MEIDNNPISIKSLANRYHLDGKQLQKQYKNHLSDYKTWDQLSHSEEWMIFEKNIGTKLSLDETSISNGELYTVLTNKAAKGNKGAIIAMIKGVKSEGIIKLLEENISLEKRRMVKEITIDMANNMEKIGNEVFQNSSIVTDRFHVQQLINDAMQEIRIRFRWKAIDEENEAIKKAKKLGKKYYSPTYKNGDTKKQLLARSRYLLFKPSNKWTTSQKIRSEVLFKEFPDIEKAYKHTMHFRGIFEHSKDKETAKEKIFKWIKKINGNEFESFQTAGSSIVNHFDTILNYFDNRSTNASAESFNAKIKSFRATFRGVRDVKFFLYRLQKLYA